MGDWIGVQIGTVSSSLGGTGAAVTLFLAVDADPLTIVILRWGIGFLCVLPIVVILRVCCVASTMTVNPIAAAIMANLLIGEPITLNLIIGLVAVFAGIWLATTEAAVVVDAR